MTRDQDTSMRLPSGLNDPQHPQVHDFTVGNARTFEEKSVAFEATMHPGRNPVTDALGARATPAAIGALHDRIMPLIDEA